MKIVSFAAAVVVTAMVLLAGGTQAVDFTNSGNAVNSAMNGIMNPNFANAAAGEPYANVMGTSVTIQREFRRALPSIYSYTQTAHYQDRADAGISGEAYANVDSQSYVVCPTTMCAPGKKWVMWDVPFYMNATQKATDGALGYSTAVSGFATGLSRMIGESSAIGIAVGYDARRMTPKDGYHFRNRADTLHTAVYGGTNIGNFFLDGYAGWSRSWNRMEREVTDGGAFSGINKANYKDNVYSAGLKLSYVWIFQNDVRITPSLGLDFSHVRMDAINERSHSTNFLTTHLRGDKSNYSSLAVPLMVSVNKTFASNILTFRGAQSLWTPEVRGGYVPVIGSKRTGVDMAFADGGRSWKTTGARYNGSYGTVGGGLKMKLADKYIFEVAYDYTFGKKYNNHSVTGMYGVSF